MGHDERGRISPKKTLLGLCFGFVVLVILGWLALLLYSIGKRDEAYASLQKPAAWAFYEDLLPEWTAYQQAEKDGEAPSHDLDPEVVRALEAFEDLLERYKNIFSKYDRLYEISQYPETKSREITHSEWEEIEDGITELQEYIDDIREAAMGEGPIYPIDLSRGLAMELPHLAPMRSFTRLLYLDSLIADRVGDYDRVKDNVAAQVWLGDALAREPSLISQLIRVALANITFDTIRQCLPSTGVDSDIKVELVAALTNAHHRDAFADSIQGDAQGIALWFSSLRDPDAEEVGTDFVLSGSSNSPNIAIFLADYTRRFPMRPLLNLDEATGLRMYQQIAKAARLPYWQAVATLDELHAEVESLFGLRFMSRELLLSTGRANETQARYEAFIGLIRLGLTIEAYREEEGLYPYALEEIEPLLGVTLQLDPYSGQPYIYVPKGESYLLYSVGSNQVDDGGAHNLYPSEPGDIVWRGVAEKS